MNVTACYRGKTDFEGRSFEDMHAMVANAMPGDLTSTGHALLAAQKDIQGIASDLQKYGDGVEWQGEGADAFHSWVKQLSKQSFTLANYTGTAGDHILAAGQALSEVTWSMYSMSQGGGKASESNRQEAINQMNKLTSYYVTSTQTISQQEEPNFQPMPMSMVDGSGRSGGLGDHSYGTYGPATAGGNSPSSVYEPSASRGASIDTSGVVTTPRSDSTTGTHQAPHGGPEGDVGSHTTIDSAPPISVAPTPTQHGNGAPTEPTVARPVGLPPVIGNPGLGLGLFTPGVPTGPVAGPRGIGGLGGDRLPSGGKLPSEAGGDGIVGGIPSRNGPSVSAPRLPRGTVVGAEGEQPAAGSMFRGPLGAGTAVHGGGQVPRSPLRSGRRLASEPGGVVGEARTSGSAAREFTPGGSGLIREGQGTGMMPSTGVRSVGGARWTSSARPDYLEEDEETWKMGRQDVVPPVME